jgi:hypothetical protein
VSRTDRTPQQTDPARTRLARERPRPDAAFARALRENAAELWATKARPAHLWLIVGGLVLLAVVLGVIAIILALH